MPRRPARPDPPEPPSTRIGGGEQTEIIIASHLGELAKVIFSRPPMTRPDPIAIDPQFWHQAYAEMSAILEARGWPLAFDNRLRCDGVTHFMLYGTPIVMLNG